MKWVVESSPAAVTRRSGKTATFSLMTVTRQRGARWRWGVYLSHPPTLIIASPLAMELRK
ncbi:unnamed protein product [Spirodela intermedia]|uniref:Uncharacterized protein n=1 Tax=Spirodela intermedia TaxID=51605 RepID=A0A7I8LMK7_SPIIN|nr:unnamed protein product [Spirodela intermedia]